MKAPGETCMNYARTLNEIISTKRLKIWVKVPLVKFSQVDESSSLSPWKCWNALQQLLEFDPK